MAGRLSVIVGPMFSGKSTELVGRLASAARRGRAVQAFRPRRDTRDDEARVVTHDGARWPALRVRDVSALLARVAPEAEVVGIDESNMLGDGLLDACLELMRSGRDVVVAGLSLDFRGLPFEPIPSLMCVADEVVTRAARCGRCGAPARFSRRLVESEARILPGGAGAYEPRCLGCFDAPTLRAAALG